MASAAALAMVPGGFGLCAAPRRLILGGTGMALATMHQLGEGFVASHPDLDIEVKPSLGTSGGLAALSAGVLDFALVARPLSEAELSRGLRAMVYAETPVAFVTHPDNPATGISLPGVAHILRGEMMAWPDGTPMRLVRRDLSDADWTMLRRLSPEMAAAVEVALKRPGLLTVGTDQENAEALQRLRGSFGMLSISQLRAEALRLKPLLLDDVPPAAEAVRAGRYRLSRRLHIAWRGDPAPPLATFLAYLGSAEAQARLAALGHLVPN